MSLAFQCIINIGVRGSELIRSRVVQAGTLDVVGCILESWLASKGFAVGPSPSATGMPRETRKRHAARKQAQAEVRAHQQAVKLARALERRQEFSHDSLQIIRGRSRASELMIRPTDTATTEVKCVIALIILLRGQRLTYFYVLNFELGGRQDRHISGLAAMSDDSNACHTG